MLNEIDQREKDIQELCDQVKDMTPNVWHNSNGADDTTCPLCGESVRWETYSMSGMPHKPNCAYLIAKDLSTGKN